jgi:hypothetical protein
MFRGMVLRRSLLKVAVMTLVLVLASAAAVLTRSSGRAVAATFGPVAEYSFDQDPGEAGTIEDQSGDGHTATIHGAEWTAHGRYGGAMEFDAGEGEELTVPASEEFELEEFTLEAWVRPEEARELAPVVANTTTGPEAGPGYALFAGGDGGELGHPEAFATEGDLIGPSAAGEKPLRDHAWTHLAATYDGSKVRLYADGVLVDESAADPIGQLGEGELQIGGDEPWDEGGFFDGRIDELRIYDRALDEAEVAQDMETPIQTPKSGPVAEYSFDEGGAETEATTVQDLSDHGHTATIEGATWARGRYGAGLEFHGAAEEDVLRVPDSPELDLGEGFTLEAWVRPGEGDNTWAPLISKSIPGDEGLTEYAYYLYAGDYEEDRPAGGVFEGEYLHADASLPVHAWSQVTLTFDGATERLYVDGALVDEGTGEAPPVSGGDLEIGGSVGHTNFFDGRIDEVRIYDRGLSAAEVGADMETPIQTPKAGPVAAYSFDEGEIGTEGGTVQDVSGNEHTATLEGGADRVKGKYGNAVHFLNEGDCASVPDSPELRLSEEFTLEAWVRPEGGGVYEDPVVVRESEGNAVFGLGIGSRDPEFAEGFIGEGKGSKAAIGGEELRENAWVHLATTYDGADLRLYVDGELVATKAAPTGPAVGEGTLHIGCDGPDGPFGGKIDEVRLYGRALNAAEVDSDMESPLQTPKATPVAAYSFDEKNEETAADITGDGHTATVEGAKWTEHGRYGGAMEFKASEGDALKIPASEELDFDEEFTLEAWVRPSGEDNHHAPLIDKQEGSGHGYLLYEGGSVSDRPYGAANEEQEFIHAEEPLPANTWSHVALTFSGNRIYLYVNGELVDNGGAAPTVTSEGELEIGGSTDTADYFDGRIDEVRIYNRALEPAEVDADMEAPIQTPRRGPVAAWSFDEEGPTFEDLTGDGNTVTSEGATWTPHGRYGGALEFSGEESCATVPTSESLQLDEEFTLEAWVRPSGLPTDDPIFFKESEGTYSYPMFVGFGNEGQPEGSADGEHVLDSHTIEPGVWTHIAFTYDGQTLRLYVDGELVESEHVGELRLASEGPLYIGCDPPAWGDHFRGRIDEARIYERALGQGEVAADMDGSASQVVHARLITEGIAGSRELTAEEWAQPERGFERRQTQSVLATRGFALCSENDTTRCAISRTLALAGAEEPESIEQEQTLPGAPLTALHPVTTLMGAAEAGLRHTNIRRPEATFLRNWQTPPPNHGSTVELIESSLSAAEEREVEEEVGKGPLRYWVDTTTGLPIEQEVGDAQSNGSLTFYDYDSHTKPLSAYPSSFFLAKATGSASASQPFTGNRGQGTTCSPSGAGWGTNEEAGAYPDPRAPGLLETSLGTLLFDPMGEAAAWPGQRVALEPFGLAFESLATDDTTDAWEIHLASGEAVSVELEGEGAYILVNGTRVAHVEVEREPSKDQATTKVVSVTSAGTYLTLPMGARAEVTPVDFVSSGPSWETAGSACSSSDASSASSLTPSHGLSTAASGQTAQIKVWVNPHDAGGVGSVLVKISGGSCTETEKSTNPEGFAVFGGCAVGSSFLVRVPEHVTNEGREFEDRAFGNADDFTLTASGAVLTFKYELIGEGSGPGEEPPPEEGSTPKLGAFEVETTPTNPEAEEEEAKAEASIFETGATLPAKIQKALDQGFIEDDDCAIADFVPFLHNQPTRLGYSIGTPVYIQCVPFPVFAKVQAHAYLFVYHGETESLELRASLGPINEGIIRPTGPLEKPSFGGPYHLSVPCIVKRLQPWHVDLEILGLIEVAPFVEIASKIGANKIVPCV